MTAKAHFHVPHGLEPGIVTEKILFRLREVNAMMMGKIPTLGASSIAAGYDDEDVEGWRIQDESEEMEEERLQLEGAEIARDKLDVMTRRGKMPLTERQWEDFVAVWSPHFDQLPSWTWKGKRTYVY